MSETPDPSDIRRANLRLATSFTTAAAFAIAMAWLLIVWRGGVALLAALVGTALGWAAGILLAPYKEEESKFRRLSKIAAAFISGYAAGKIDRIFELLTDKTSGKPPILDPQVFRPILMAITAFVVTGITVFVARCYSRSSEDKNAGSEEAQPKSDAAASG